MCGVKVGSDRLVCGVREWVSLGCVCRWSVEKGTRSGRSGREAGLRIDVERTSGGVWVSGGAGVGKLHSLYSLCSPTDFHSPYYTYSASAAAARGSARIRHLGVPSHEPVI